MILQEEGLDWVVGAGGLLGSAVERSLWPAQCFVGSPIDWSGTGVSSISTSAYEFVEEIERRCPTHWTVYWCAGVGIIGTSEEALAEETSRLGSLLDVLSAARTPGTLVLSSSAGGVYGGRTEMPVSEFDATAPISAYGRNKMVQEAAVDAWAERTTHRAVVARIANLYGPGQKLGKRQGLISQVCLATLRREPIPIYVSLDTLRDYVYVDDCARTLIAAAERIRSEAGGTTIRKIVATGASISIGAILAECRRVLHRPVSYTTSTSRLASQQGSVVSFRSQVWPEVVVPITPLPVGIHRTAEDLRHLLRAAAIDA